MGRSPQRYVNVQGRMRPKTAIYRRAQPFYGDKDARKHIETSREIREAHETLQSFCKAGPQPNMSGIGDGSPYIALALGLTALGGFAVAPGVANAESSDYKAPSKSPEKSR